MAGAGDGQWGRSWRRYRRRPVGVQVIPLVLVVVLVVAISLAAGGGTHPTTTTSTTAAASPVTAPDEASTSSAGVTARTINVVFPVSNLSTLAAKFGFAGDIEYGEQAKAIKLFVKPINDAGGIHGRKINADDRGFRPHQRGGHAGSVQAVDRGRALGLRRARRDRDLDR